MGYFAKNLEKELNNRSIPVKCIVGKTDAARITLEILKYQIVNTRATGFSPWESVHLFSGVLINNDQKIPIKAYFYNGKVPVWSMDEIEEPCFNTPISVIIKEVASKINREVFKFSIPDEKVEQLKSEIKTELEKKNSETFWKVLELGYTNNTKAMPSLKEYAQSDQDQFFRSCALTAIGTLGAAGEFAFLREQFRVGNFNDRYMAAKAIGDIGTPEAIKALQEMKKDDSYGREIGLRYCVDFYVQ
ncbi:MAG: HEAT repeat domain-containing protein [Syntrophaceae bacterium]|nr:HEAT repeat domain-containing protein [Syntrophaceae bacterium]